MKDIDLLEIVNDCKRLSSAIQICIAMCTIKIDGVDWFRAVEE